MPFLSTRSKLQLNDKEIENLTTLSTSRTAPLREVEIADKMGTNRQKVIRCINKALAYGIDEAINDLPRSGKPPEITGEARAWIISIACMKPKDVGYPHELWTHKLLAEHIKKNCVAMGFPEASRISSGTISKILGAR